MASTSFIVNKKRRFNEGIIFKSAKRPIDKQIINTALTLNGTQTGTNLWTTTFPGTITGIRVDLTLVQSAGTAPGAYAWAIVLIKEGQTASTIGLTNGTTFYQPEANVLMFGRGTHSRATSDTVPRVYEQSTKTMRKLQCGDKIDILVIGEATNTTLLNGAIQFFIKT